MKIILNFKNPDEFKRLEHQAYNGTLDVSDFPPAEYKYFSELRKIPLDICIVLCYHKVTAA